ncbi:hypothetical protein AAG570_013271 [Ranatra chinensis]|uniref:Splicing factor 45 n=1 Tax=Ranatra chinensis TaxID=642074 RepID=A0ABD0YYP6_9HEMI
MKLFKTQLQLKKASHGQPKRDNVRRVSSVLAPVFDLNSKKDEDDGDNSNEQSTKGKIKDLDWSFDEAEYDPSWPNDYEKVVKDLRELREKEKEKEDEERQKKREDRQRTRESRFEPIEEKSGDEEDEKPARIGVAIAPPPSLQEQVIPKAYGASVAAKIMAKYGFKEGQGLGKKEQGISMALQVEKTSKRGGRIIHEKDIMPPPFGSNATPVESTPPRDSPKQELSITEIMKTPSKVVLLRNMVGPGEVDQDLEPEVRDECNGKYGDVVNVLIYELPNVNPDDAVRIFVEFKRIESAIKAVVDLNGRFFGGRQVRAGFYSAEKFEALDLLD